jgi:hypothetical protein
MTVKRWGKLCVNIASLGGTLMGRKWDVRIRALNCLAGGSAKALNILVKFPRIGSGHFLPPYSTSDLLRIVGHCAAPASATGAVGLARRIRRQAGPTAGRAVPAFHFKSWAL